MLFHPIQVEMLMRQRQEEEARHQRRYLAHAVEAERLRAEARPQRSKRLRILSTWLPSRRGTLGNLS